MKVRILFSREKEGGYSVGAPALPGCVSGGETKDQARDNIRQAIVGWLAAKNLREVPPETNQAFVALTDDFEPSSLELVSETLEILPCSS